MTNKAVEECEKVVTRAERRRQERKAKEQEKQRQKKIKEAIVMINDCVKLRLGASSGKVVVYAMRDIKKGEKMYATSIPCLVDIPYKDFNKIRPETREMIIQHFPQVINGSHFMCPDTLMQMYIQHSDEPNYDSLTDKALKKIYKGEEVTQNYNEVEGCEEIVDLIK